MSISITWHGHATFSLDINGTSVVVDPFFAGNNPAATTSAADVTADFILQTHGHGDHIADTVGLAKRTGAQVIANFEICNWIGAQGHENLHAMNTGGGYNFTNLNPATYLVSPVAPADYFARPAQYSVNLTAGTSPTVNLSHYPYLKLYLPLANRG